MEGRRLLDGTIVGFSTDVVDAMNQALDWSWLSLADGFHDREGYMATFAAGAGLLILAVVVFWACMPKDGQVAPFLDGRINLQTYLGLFITIGLFGGILMMIFGANQ
jgi:hypothetical protein